MAYGDFPDDLVLRLHTFNSWGEGSVPGQGAKIPYASRSKKQNIKQK